MKESCKQGNHTLEVIYEQVITPLSSIVVRWCSECGSIVKDRDSDGRISPGYFMKMKSPNLSK